MLNFDIQLAIKLITFLIVAIIIGSVVLVLALNFDVQMLAALVTGLMIGGIISMVLGFSVQLLTTGLSLWFALTLALVICFVSVYISIQKRKEIFPQLSTDAEKDEIFTSENINNLLLDDSVLYDARIINILRTKFFERKLELTTATMQTVYDMANKDSNPEIQQKGIRALETIANLKNEYSSYLMVTDEKASNTDLPLAQQLFDIAKRRKIGILTSDFAVSNAAKQQGIFALNILELVYSTRAVVFQGQKIILKITQKGKTVGEGIGIMQDGTKVIVDNGEVFMGQETNVVVDSVLETVAGRLIQASLEQNA